MEKLEIPLENEGLRNQLDWIIDRANEDTTNLNFPAVIIYSYYSCVIKSFLPMKYKIIGILGIHREFMERWRRSSMFSTV